MENINKIESWIVKNYKSLLIGFALLLILLLGFLLGKNSMDLKTLNEKKKQIELENKSLKIEIDSLVKIAQEKVKIAKDLEKQSEEDIKIADIIHEKNKTKQNEGKKEMDRVSSLDADSLKQFFSREAEQYIQQDN